MQTHRPSNPSQGVSTRRMSIGWLLCYCCVSVWLMGCSSKVPSSVIQPTEMAALLCDYHIAQAVGNEYNGREHYKQALLISYVFEKHHTTQEEFDSALVWYTRNAEFLSKVYDDVNDRLKALNKIVIERSEWDSPTKFPTVSGDTVDIWYWARTQVLTTAMHTNTLYFMVPTDTTFHVDDRFCWRIQAHYLRHDTLHHRVIAELGIRYYNDSTVSVIKDLAPGLNELRLTTAEYKVKHVRGMIYYQTDSITTTPAMVCIGDIALTRYHRTTSDTLSAEVAVVEEKEKKESPIDVIPLSDAPIPPIVAEEEDEEEVSPDDIDPAVMTPEQKRAFARERQQGKRK